MTKKGNTENVIKHHGDNKHGDFVSEEPIEDGEYFVQAQLSFFLITWNIHSDLHKMLFYDETL